MTRGRLVPWLAALLLAAACGSRQAAAPASPQPPASAEPAGYQGPRIVLESPSRGLRLAEGGTDPWPVTVRGRACDEAHALTHLRVAGQEVALAGPGPCHAFEVAVASARGLTLVEGEAENDVGQRARLAQAILRSPTWFAPEGPEAVAPGALLVQLGPGFLDDGDRATADDLATLAERALQALDLDAAAGPLRFAEPDPDGDGRLGLHRYRCLLYTTTNRVTGFEAWKSGPLTRGGVAVERLALADGGLEARLSVRDLRVPFSVTGSLDSGCLGQVQETVSGEVRAAALTLAAGAQVGLGPSGPEVGFAAAEASLTGLEVAIDLGPLDFVGLGRAIGDAIEARIRGPAQAAMAAAATSLVREELAAALAAVAARSAAVRLPPQAGGGELRLDARLEVVDFTPQRAVLASGMAIGATAPLHGGAGPPGALRLGGALPDASGLAAADLALGLSDDALQQLLHAAWQAGAFDQAGLALPPSAGLPGGRLTLAPALPPVLVPRPDGSPWVDLCLGDVAFELRLPAPVGEAIARGWLSAVLPVERLEVGPEGLRLLFGAEVQVRVQVDEVNWGERPASRALTEELLQRGLAALLPAQLGQALGPFPLPQLELGALDPAFAGLALRLGSPQLSRLGRHQLLSGSLEPAP